MSRCCVAGARQKRSGRRAAACPRKCRLYICIVPDCRIVVIPSCEVSSEWVLRLCEPRSCDLLRCNAKEASCYLLQMCRMASIQGTCSHPGCTWKGLQANYKKHKDGAGIGQKHRDGQHEKCVCCSFVPGTPPDSTPSLSSYQQTMALLPPFDATKVHEHLRGTFHRRASISEREYE